MSTATIEHTDHSHGHSPVSDQELWKGGRSPFGTSYGKVMMWYFLISDTFHVCFLSSGLWSVTFYAVCQLA
jgi:hypothetical protein